MVFHYSSTWRFTLGIMSENQQHYALYFVVVCEGLPVLLTIVVTVTTTTGVEYAGPSHAIPSGVRI